MYDLCLISLDENKNEIQELKQELNLLGTRIIIEDIDLKEDVTSQLEEKLKRVSSVLLLVKL
jgi:hypothetical protein